MKKLLMCILTISLISAQNNKDTINYCKENDTQFFLKHKNSLYNQLIVNWENDMFFYWQKYTAEKHTDKNYTNGLKISYFNKAFNKIPFQFIVPLYKKLKMQYGLGINSLMYTPHNIDNVQCINNEEVIILDKEDRPFASTLLLSYEFKSLRTPNSKFFVQGNFNLGIIGPHAFGKEIQLGIHKVVQGRNNRGWVNQMQQDIALQYKVKTGLLIHNKNHQWNINPYTVINLGTLINSGGLGTEIYWQLNSFDFDLISQSTFEKTVESINITANSIKNVDADYQTNKDGKDTIYISVKNENIIKKLKNIIDTNKAVLVEETIESNASTKDAQLTHIQILITNNGYYYIKGQKDKDSCTFLKKHFRHERKIIKNRQKNFSQYKSLQSFAEPIRKNHFNLRIFVDGYVNLVAHNAFLQGSLDNRKTSNFILPDSRVKRAVYTIRTGVSVKVPKVIFGYTFNFRSKEFIGNESSNQVWGAFHFVYLFR